MAKQIRVSVDEIEEDFEWLEDSRSDINQKYPFVGVIVMAVLAGAGVPTATWTSDRVGFLSQYLSLPN